jgi:IS4 transposase
MFSGHLSLQLVDLRMEHQGNGFMGCDYNIELFFKAIQQNLRIKTFLGTSENAVMTQVWAALITYLILAFLRFKAGLGLSFQQLLRLLQLNLFDQRNLGELCNPQTDDVAERLLLWAV